MAIKYFKHKDSPYNRFRLKVIAEPGKDVLFKILTNNGFIVEVQLDTMTVYRLLEFVKENY